MLALRLNYDSIKLGDNRCFSQVQYIADSARPLAQSISEVININYNTLQCG